MRFARSLFEFVRLLLLAVVITVIIGSIADHIPPLVWLVVGVSVVVLFLFLVAMAFVRGWREPPAARPTPKGQVARAEEREHPVLGRYWAYVREGVVGSWNCDLVSKVLGCEICLWGKGPEPTAADIERWNELERKLPAILADLPPPDEDDGWGHAPGTFTPSQPRSISVRMGADSGFLIFPKLVSSDDYALIPMVHVYPNGEIWCEGWSA